jgi:hypothetical protein
VLRDVTFRVLPAGYRWRGSTIDLSPSGVRLFTQQALQIGDVIELTWPLTPSPVTLAGRIARVQIGVDGTCAGVQFIAPVLPQVFLALSGKLDSLAGG